MPSLFLALLFRILMEVVRENIRTRRDAKPNPICSDCVHAHAQYDAKAKRAISCTYGGFVRPVKLDVLYCTDYHAQNARAKPRGFGFVQSIAPAEEMVG